MWLSGLKACRKGFHEAHPSKRSFLHLSEKDKEGCMPRSSLGAPYLSLLPTAAAFRSMHFQHAFWACGYSESKYNNSRKDSDYKGSLTRKFQSLYGYAASLLAPSDKVEVNRWQLEGNSQPFNDVLFQSASLFIIFKSLPNF